MERYGVEWEQKGTHEKHLSVLDYEKKMRSQEVEALTEEIAEKQCELKAVREQIETYDDGRGIENLIEQLNSNEFTLPEPTPPKENDLQKYILNYLAEKDDKYIAWFLHHYEKTINDKVFSIVQDYAMYGHFADIKQAYVIGLLKALQDYDPARGVPFIVYKEYAAMREVHEYIRTMRTGFTVQSNDEYLRLRKAMRIFREYGGKADDDTIKKVADNIGTSTEDAAEIIRCGMQNMQFVDYYRQYADEDSGESREEVAHDGSAEPDKIFFKLERAEAVMAEFEKLNFRERAMVAAHLGFCMECYATHYYDADDLDEDGKPTRKPFLKEAFIDIAIDHGLASPDTADKTYRRALNKMKLELKRQGINKA